MKYNRARPANIIPITGGELSGRVPGKVLLGGADYQNLSGPAAIDARYLWQANNGDVSKYRIRNAHTDIRGSSRQLLYVPQHGLVSEFASRYETGWRRHHDVRK